jgi:hypothetical protein
VAHCSFVIETVSPAAGGCPYWGAANTDASTSETNACVEVEHV